MTDGAGSNATWREGHYDFSYERLYKKQEFIYLIFLLADDEVMRIVIGRW